MAIPRILLKKILLIREAGFECEEADGLYEWAKCGTQILTANSHQRNFRYKRHIFERDNIIYKFWWPGYYLQENLMWGIQTGFITKEFCPALIGIIFHITGICGGYWMHRIKICLPHNALHTFQQDVAKHSRKTGCRYADYHNKNVGTYNGQNCLIDLESVTDL